MKQSLDLGKQAMAKMLDRVMIALHICERRIALNSDEIFSAKDLSD
jgi:hypothetical protein